MYKTLLVKQFREVIEVQLNRPEIQNAVNIQLCEDLLSSFQHDKKIYILRGNGKAFSSGGDLKYVYQNILEGKNSSKLGDLAKKTVYKLNSQKSILITMLDGYVMGIGGGLGLWAPIRIATENTKFAMPECKFGHVPDGGAGAFLARMPYNVGKYLGLSGDIIDGIELAHLGEADFLVESDSLNKITNEIENSHFLRDVGSIKEFLLQKYCQKHKTTYKPDHIRKVIFDSFNLQQIIDDTKHYDQNLSQRIQQNCPSAQNLFLEIIKMNNPPLSLKENLIIEQQTLDITFSSQDIKEGLHKLFKDKQYIPKWSNQTLKLKPTGRETYLD